MLKNKFYKGRVLNIMEHNDKILEEIDEVNQSDDSWDLFANIGATIKALARVNAWIGIIASIIIAFIMIPNEDVAGWGFAILICGPLISWISSTTIYGFGQLIENTDIIVELLDNE